MTRLDAAAQFIPKLIRGLNTPAQPSVANRKQSTTASKMSAVVAREAALVWARSKFNMIWDRPVSVILFRGVTKDIPVRAFPKNTPAGQDFSPDS